MSYFDVNNITVAFGGVRALNDVSFSVNQNEIFTIIGPNGAGKSTLFNVISRIYQPNNGNVVFDGKDVLNLKAHQISQIGIARTFQNIELFEQASVLQNLLVARQTHRRSNPVSEILFSQFVKKEEYRHRLEVEKVIDFLDLQAYRQKFISGLPYGVRKVVELGRALSIEPKLLLLDEPASGLSVEETQDVAFWIEDIKKVMGITVLMVEHDMHLVTSVSDRVMALADGKKLAMGSPEEVKNHPAVIEAYLGVSEENEK